MNFKEILELIDKVADRDIASLEIEQAGMKLRIEGSAVHRAEVTAAAFSPVSMPLAISAAPPAIAAAPPPLVTGGSGSAAAPAALEEGTHIVTSPIVGTFYRSPNPEAQSFVNVGDHVAKGQVLCIIEAMKLMNEIESDVEGTVVKIFPQNGQPIEYGEQLFAVKA